MRTKPGDFFQQSVKHVYLGANEAYTQVLLAVLRLRPEIISLAHSHDEPELFELIKGLHGIRRWSGFLFVGLSTIDLSLAVFRSVTHMDVYDDIDANAPFTALLCAGLSALPALTHLCLNRGVGGQILRNLLHGCPHLQILVNMWADRIDAIAAVGVEDVRYVVVVCDALDYWFDWEVGALGGTDFWAAADDFVARKGRGEIEVLLPPRKMVIVHVRSAINGDSTSTEQRSKPCSAHKKESCPSATYGPATRSSTSPRSAERSLVRPHSAGLT
ncbi:hypothetical protein C8R45DRAFT_1020097 [Mycena sanguinolenta]|nr:hypothetical protein C8R45DRAFT_1020097 [Mycena sanguinolenta]